MDLTKAYEKVCHYPLIEAAVMWNFPLYRLRVRLQQYRGPRALSLAGVCSMVTQVHQSMLAGCPFATSLLRLFRMAPLGSMVEKWPTVFPFNVVDDITLFMSGSAKFAQVGLGNATAHLCEILEELCPVISESKGKIVSLCKEVAR
eukprot:6454595-Pyramimonas_sp.AAC.1